MQGQVNEMKDEQRPWTYADLGIGGRPYRTQSNGFDFLISLTFHNVGHSPALCFPNVEGYLLGNNDQSSIAALRPRQKPLRCASATTGRPRSTWRNTISRASISRRCNYQHFGRTNRSRQENGSRPGYDLGENFQHSSDLTIESFR